MNILNRKRFLLPTSLILIIDWLLITLLNPDQILFSNSFSGLLFILFVFLSFFWLPILLSNYFVFLRKKSFKDTPYFKIISYLQKDKDNFFKSLQNTISVLTYACLMVYILIFVVLMLSIIS